ncbi:MAG: hypothetical protein M1838_000366 [Thelocarpon superellum]|nr:MAG: hypothetical protein M1838_000366 [Thelocarpon superellum]
MADTALESHKRSKSSAALSLLHRDRGRKDKNGSDATSTAALEVNSSKTSLVSPPDAGLMPSKSTIPSGRTSSTSIPTTASLHEPGPSSHRNSLASDVAPESLIPDRTTSIEQSVRMFRLFEALRSGDTAAILKAAKETSAKEPAEGRPRQSTSSLSSMSDRTGPLDGTTILHLSIQCAEVTVVEFLLSTAATTPGVGLDINARDREGNTPLHLAAALGRAQIVRLLLDQKNVNDSIANHQGRQPIDLARTPEIFQQLQLARSVFLDRRLDEFHGHVARHEYEALEKVLAEPRLQTLLDVNGTELATEPMTVQTGGTLLHEAARRRDPRLLEILLLNGADPFRRDRKGKLPQDVTKDEKTRTMLKKSPAAAAAQRGIQERSVLGGVPAAGAASPGGGTAADGALASKEGREMKGYLKKWTNYTSGYKLRWFVLEDGVLSYYKHQDDAGSACRGAINMRIAKLFMDPQDKQRFEIQGKSSVKYHLKANHVIEAKRWFWALNNAIQWTKDEAKEEAKKKNRQTEILRQARLDQAAEGSPRDKDGSGEASSMHSRRQDSPSRRHLHSASRSALGGSSRGPASFMEDDEAAGTGSYEASLMGEVNRIATADTATVEGGDPEDEDDFMDDASSHHVQPTSKDAFNITAQSARLQLDLLGHVAAALQAERTKNGELTLSDTRVAQALASYETAVRSLKGLIGDLLKISRDRDAYWQYRLDREADVRRLWEDSMARVAQEQEALEGRIGESEDKRRRTKRALREALEYKTASGAVSRPRSPGAEQEPRAMVDAVEQIPVDPHGKALVSPVAANRRKSAFAEVADLSDSDSGDDEEFFDAVGAGEVEVVGELPVRASSPPAAAPENPLDQASREAKKKIITSSFAGYEEPVRSRLKLDADDRPKISLWGVLKSMIGKDMTKMTLPVSFNEPTSLLQRVAEDMEYTELLDTAADRTDSAERMVYVAAFATSEYASTIGRVAKPFNPLLGETFEYARPDKGYRFFVEQVSHHPPIGAVHAESSKWDYYGESNVKSKFYGKSFEFNHLGTWFLRLRSASGGEELYSWKKVTASVVGIITNNPTVDNYGPMEIKNWTTGDVCRLDFKPRGWKASSAYQVQGKVVSADGITKWSIGGRWNDKLYARPGYEFPMELGGTTAPAGGNTSPNPNATQAFLVWQANPRPPGVPFNLTPFVITLNALPSKLKPYLAPTDTRLRPDQRAMEDGEYDLAATEKNRVEEKQRAKRRQREASGEEFEPRWFRRTKCPTTGEDLWDFTGEYWTARQRLVEGQGGWERVEDIF